MNRIQIQNRQGLISRSCLVEVIATNFSTITTPEVVQASIELPSMPSQVEVKVEIPISNVNAQQAPEVVEASIVEQTTMPSQVESPISNANARQWEERNKLCILIYKAASKGDWNEVDTAPRSNKSAGRLEITERGERPLHIAAANKQTAFVHDLVKQLDKEDLKLPNNYGDTTFSFAAISGVVEIAKVMYEKNNALPTIRDKNQLSPIQRAASMGKKKMVQYLYDITPVNKDFKAKERMDILVALIDSDMYDIALKILEADRYIVRRTPKSTKGSALHALARKPLSHYGTSQEWLCERLVRIVPHIHCFKRIYGSIQKRRQAILLVEKLCEQILILEGSEISNLFNETPILTDATKIGNIEFMTLLISSFPELVWRIDSDKHSIFHVAVIYRQEKVFSLIHHTKAIKDLLILKTDKEKNNILHLAVKLPPSSRLNSVSGAALQMQSELRWFKEVEKILRPLDVRNKNKQGKTPRELFTEEHEKLRKAGEKWMKDTATSCMVVATLIATVALNASFTVPDGNKEAHNRWFTVFVTSNAVAMFSSAASIMTFLSILTSRYGEDDFLYILPVKLMVGLFTLFASIVCMLLKFSATYFLAHKEEKPGISPKIVAGLALLPITLYVMLNFRLWNSLIRSTIQPSRFMS
ncbi:uncharacterized protein LOC111407291 isoform X2 [Olea europaea var. sylvestris]|uniref:uncharacterized protein LOC111407291 isoform X2 n=1 Tax=Olea europaea var. sylvestris TaxID=158386 RepID=UPI000C1D1F22|nr:uncharacterized protein LOC111407291 isoform X2 [Olea europaea var. sylvestris]XP_022892463.1 uncharacterized protein LOC111407291 isoform X2 [Olea europaea var. sylvestris]XP_022892464.1 uncharacterized protein LOC111407291 isoform X2 [Olea europaea var. sylvestris]